MVLGMRPWETQPTVREKVAMESLGPITRVPDDGVMEPLPTELHVTVTTPSSPCLVTFI